MNIKVDVARNGDGWLSVARDEWIEAKLGEPDQDLTYDLAVWAEDNLVALGYRGSAPIDWARARFGALTGPTSEDERPVIFNSAASDNILDDDIAVIFLRVQAQAMTLTLAVVDKDDGDSENVYVVGPDEHWAEVIHWSRAFGGCPNGHTFVVEAACYLDSDQNKRTSRLSELCALPDPDVPYKGGYVACPDCTDPRQAIQFTA